MAVQAWHLVQRFFGSLRPGPPDAADEAWLLGLLSDAEAALYRAQPEVDRRHSVLCAVAVRNAVGDGHEELAVASALHDVGKADAKLGTFGRVVATLIGMAYPRARVWQARKFRGRVGAYLRHPDHGAGLLSAAGSSQTAITWAREHHLDQEGTTLPPDTWSLLAKADHPS